MTRFIPLLAAALIWFLVSGFSSRHNAETWLVIGGNTEGYLSPCGCTSPMSGGIRRRIQLMNQLVEGRQALKLESGGLVAGTGRQDQLKGEALAEALATAKFDAVHIGLAESRLGVGGVTSLFNLLGGAGLSTSMSESSRFPVQSVLVKNGFAVGGIDAGSVSLGANLSEASRSASVAMNAILEVAKLEGLVPVVLFQGSLDQAKALPRVNEVSIVVYRSGGAPTEEPIVQGETRFVSPGEKGKAVLALKFQDGKLIDTTAYQLPPEVGDDHATSRVYDRYLKRVSDENLLDAVPKIGTAKFSGNAKCGSCHSQAHSVWKKSEHNHALKTLEVDGHGKDPDCVKCHVVGLSTRGGFLSRIKTPQLTDVGCESCHGAGAAHSAAPAKYPMPKRGVKACMSCHNPANSPNFDFEKYWAKIKH